MKREVSPICLKLETILTFSFTIIAIPTLQYLTGCSATWIDLTLAPDVQTAPVESVVTCEGPTELKCDVVETAPTLDGKNFLLCLM